MADQFQLSGTGTSMREKVQEKYAQAQDTIENKVASTDSTWAIKKVTLLWLVLNLFVFILFVCGCVVASKENVERVFGFAAMWTTIVLIVINVIGTIIMRKYRTPVSMGMFLGFTSVMANQAFIVGVVFAAKSDSDGKKAQTYNADVAFSIFCFFIAFLYTCFSLLLCFFRRYLIKADAMLPTDIDVPNADSEPPAPTTADEREDAGSLTAAPTEALPPSEEI